MTSKYDDYEYNEPAVSSGDDNKSLPRDCFELLSAYIDGELSPDERSQVQHLLDRDQNIKNIYTQLLALQGQIQRSTAPPSNKSVEEITAGVFQSIEHRRRQRRVAWGVSALAASIMAGITGLIPGFAPGLKMARILDSGGGQPVMIAVAINKPAIDIPKAINGSGVKLNDF